MWPPPARGNNHQSLFRKNLLDIGISNHLHKLCKVYHNQRDQLLPPRLPSSVNDSTHYVHWVLQYCPAHPQWMLLLIRNFGMYGWSFLLSIPWFLRLLQGWFWQALLYFHSMCSTISWLSLNWEVIRGLIDQSLMDFWPLAGRLTFTSWHEVFKSPAW